MEDKKKALYESPRRVTWDLCDTRRSSNRYVGTALGKCALTTVDGRSFLRSIEHCAPWTIRSRRRIRGGVRRMIGGGGVSNNEKLSIQELLV